MHNLSMKQALSLWSDLEAAYYGKNGYGGDTAEIYGYRYRRGCPSLGRLMQHPDYIAFNATEPLDITTEIAFDTLLDAARSLLAIVQLFEETHDARITIADLDAPASDKLGELAASRAALASHAALFAHRIHLRVAHKDP